MMEHSSDNIMTKLAKYTDELPNDFDILCIGDGSNLHGLTILTYNLIDIFIKDKINKINII